MAKGSKKKAAKLSASDSSYFGIMLDHEVDAVVEYWPVRYPGVDLEDLKKEVWIKGNISYLPVNEWSAELKISKTLKPQNSPLTFSGGIYLFTYVGGP